MELLQEISTKKYGIFPDGTDAANPGIYNNFTDSISTWSIEGIRLTDAIFVKEEIKRIVETETGDTLDDKFDQLPDNDEKKMAGRSLLFDLQKDTLTGGATPLLTAKEYADSMFYRNQHSKIARDRRWSEMIDQLSDPEIIFEEEAKFALLIEEFKKYDRDYLIADNGIFEAFIEGTDHPYSNNDPAYTREVRFSTVSNIALSTLTLWDTPTSNNTWKTTVVDIITGTIINGDQYVS